VIDAYAKSGADDAAERAEDLLRHMDELNESGENTDAKPNVRSFNTVINAYAKSGRQDAALKAESVLDLMERLYESGNEEVRPDVHSFSTVINGESKTCVLCSFAMLPISHPLFSVGKERKKWQGRTCSESFA
jgi:pentatricopeptide repeat protein